MKYASNGLIMNKTEQHKKAMLKALEKSLGVVTTACKAAKVGRTQFYEWLKVDKEFAAAVKDVENIALDFAESQLHSQIHGGNTSATIFYLKTKGRNRGYVERQEIAGVKDQPVEINVVLGVDVADKFTPENSD